MTDLSKTEYGEELAVKIADYMESQIKGSIQEYDGYGVIIGNIHRDYCGLGMNIHKGVYQIGSVNDGYLSDATKQFKTRKEFVKYLSKQSDYSFSGLDTTSEFVEPSDFYRNNQRITREKLESYFKKK